MAHRRYRRNPQGVDLGKVAIIGAVGLAFTSSAVRDAIGSAFGSVFHNVGSAAGQAQAQVAASSSSTLASVTSPASVTAMAQSAGVTNAALSSADQYGRQLWALRHGGSASGYDSLSRAGQVTWNAVAIHGS